MYEKKIRGGDATFFSVHRWQYQFFIEHSEIFTVHNPHQERMLIPSTEVLFIGHIYALLVVNLKNLEFNIFYSR